MVANPALQVVRTRAASATVSTAAYAHPRPVTPHEKSAGCAKSSADTLRDGSVGAMYAPCQRRVRPV